MTVAGLVALSRTRMRAPRPQTQAEHDEIRHYAKIIKSKSPQHPQAEDLRKEMTAALDRAVSVGVMDLTLAVGHQRTNCVTENPTECPIDVSTKQHFTFVRTLAVACRALALTTCP